MYSTTVCAIEKALEEAGAAAVIAEPAGGDVIHLGGSPSEVVENLAREMEGEAERCALMSRRLGAVVQSVRIRQQSAWGRSRRVR
jgi:hypothetical protein